MAEHEPAPPREINDPGVLVKEYLDSDDFRTELNRFLKISPLSREEADRFNGNPDMLDVYNKRRYLGSDDAEKALGNFIQSHNLRFTYKIDNYDASSRKAIETYYDQWSEVIDKGDRIQRTNEDTIIYDVLQRQYHCDAAEAITRNLTANGIIPGMHQFFEDADPVGMRMGIGREIVRRIRNDKKSRS
ncbi:hypothetical protein C4564_05200 [Candidatus Microgenomates bacterium]|nr:MAG: hypothetical protein C4564_05200 [Candidatus Microgenomates bacterium]